MKNTYRFLIAVAALALFASAGQANAQGSSSCCSASCCHDSIAASPKVRAMLDERCKSKCAAPDQAILRTTTTTAQTLIAASPKVQQMQKERVAAPVVQLGSEMAGYRPTGSDGITASPKVRATLDERAPTVQIAPLK